MNTKFIKLMIIHMRNEIALVQDPVTKHNLYYLLERLEEGIENENSGNP